VRKYGRHRPILEGNFAALIVDGNQADVLSRAADNLVVGDVKHLEGGLIGEFECGVRTGEDHANVEVADESSETLLAFAKGFNGAVLLREVSEGDKNVDYFTGGNSAGERHQRASK